MAGTSALRWSSFRSSHPGVPAGGAESAREGVQEKLQARRGVFASETL